MHEHRHESERSERRLGIAFIITASYLVVEVVGGFLFNSLALLADAGHMVSDMMALGLSWVALQIGKRSATDRHTFGFKRTEILAALLNGVALWGIVGLILYEAVRRFFAPEPTQGAGMVAIASIGLAVNLAMAAMLYRDRTANLNIKGAFLHVLSDALGSMGAIVAGVIIILTGFTLADPLVSVFIAFLVLHSSWGLVKESVHILMEGAPVDVDVKQIEECIVQQPGICCVHDLHVWSITSNRHSLSAHVVLSDASFDRQDALRNLNKVLGERFHIHHTTIQIEQTHEMPPDAQGIYCRAGTSCN